MARTPSMSVAECEAILGPRGSIRVDSENRLTARKWLTAMGFPSPFVCGLSMRELGLAYNRTDGSGLDDIRRKLADSAELLENEGNDDAPKANGHAHAIPFLQAVPVDAGNHGDTLAAAIAAIAASVAPKTQPIDETAVRKIVADALAGVAPRVIEVQVPGKDAARIEGRVHPQFERVLRLVAAGANVLLVGPAGCGKTHMAEMIAKALNASYGAIHGSAGASESALTGWLLPSDGGKFEYVAAPFVTHYEKGESLFLLDELDAFDPNMLLVANGALANGHIHIAHRKDAPTVARGKNARIMATANTYGTGANPMYSGRSSLDAATLDRFVVVTVDYDRALEADIGKAAGLSNAEMAELWAMRDKVREASVRRVISTRAFQKAAIMKAAGDNWATVKATLVEGWTRDEKAKIGM